MKMQLCGWRGAHCQPVFEQLACPGPVQDAIVFWAFFIIIFAAFFPPACLPRFTLVTSRLLPLSRLQYRNPMRRGSQ